MTEDPFCGRGVALALLWPTVALAHATTTALVRIELTDNRLHYTLSVVLPEIPNRSAELLSSVFNGDRPAADRIAEYCPPNTFNQTRQCALPDGPRADWRCRRQRCSRHDRDRLHL